MPTSTRALPITSRRESPTRWGAVPCAVLALAGHATGARADAMPLHPRPVAAATAAAATPATDTPGAVVAIGGALRYDNAAVWSRLVELAGGPGARFVVLATAAGNPERSAAGAVAALEAHGARAEHLPVAPRLEDIDLERAVRDPQLIARVAAARGVYFTGGAQERIVDTLQAGGHASPLLEAIRDLLARGGVVAGTSAGAAVMSHVMFRDATDVLAVMKGRMRDGQEVDRGLGFAAPELFVDQHFLRRGRLGRMLPLMQARGLELGLGVEENSAVVLRGPSVEVVGDGGALFVDLAQATTDPRLGAFNLSGARLTYLGDGDRLDLRTRAITPAASRSRGTRVDPGAKDFQPYFEDTPFLLDVLADGAVLRAMTHALDGPAPELRGLAFDARPDAAAPRDLGFEFRFSRGPETTGWFTADLGDEAYTVANVRLDVTPVRVAQPLYRAWQP
jgi:cyanophycinase